MIMDYEMHLTDEKSEILGRAFVLSAKEGYESKEFVKAVMSSPKIEFFINVDESADWCDEWFLFANFEQCYKFKKGKTIEEYELWFMGYLYKYWMRTRHMKAKDVYKILPFEEFHNRFGFYHTQGWDYIIEDMTQEYKEKKRRYKNN